MTIEKLLRQGGNIAVVSSGAPVITDAGSALNLAMTVLYEMGTGLIALEKSAIAEEFFVLSSGLAGEILQKFVNYHIRIAIYGDYSGYTSKPLKDFIYESNQGNQVFFVATKEEAILRLSGCPM